jgi:hypothetical protein
LRSFRIRSITSINVEMIGQTLMIQHYVAENGDASALPPGFYLRSVYPNWLHTSSGIWTLSVKRIDEARCEYTNSGLGRSMGGCAP